MNQLVDFITSTHIDTKQSFNSTTKKHSQHEINANTQWNQIKSSVSCRFAFHCANPINIVMTHINIVTTYSNSHLTYLANQSFKHSIAIKKSHNHCRLPINRPTRQTEAFEWNVSLHFEHKNKVNETCLKKKKKSYWNTFIYFRFILEIRHDPMNCIVVNERVVFSFKTFLKTTSSTQTNFEILHNYLSKLLIHRNKEYLTKMIDIESKFKTRNTTTNRIFHLALIKHQIPYWLHCSLHQTDIQWQNLFVHKSKNPQSSLLPTSLSPHTSHTLNFPTNWNWIGQKNRSTLKCDGKMKVTDDNRWTVVFKASRLDFL